MIAYIKGPIAYISDQSVVVDAHGVGYLIHVSPSTLSRLPPRGGEVQLFTYMQVSENGQSLHGFLTQEEVRLFMLLISVSGIGPKVASAVLSTLSPSQIIISSNYLSSALKRQSLPLSLYRLIHSCNAQGFAPVPS